MNSSFRYLVISALMLAAWGFMRTHHDTPTPLAAPLSAFPSTAGSWRMVRDTAFDQQTLALLRPTDYMAKRYVRADGAVADIYVGYHDGASQAGPLHSPRNCLPGSGWYEVSSHPRDIPLEGSPLKAVIAVYQQGGHAELFIYWFQVGGQSMTNEYSMKVHEILNSIRRGRRDAAFVRISVPLSGSQEQAVTLAEDFLRAVYPAIRQFLPS